MNSSYEDNEKIFLNIMENNSLNLHKYSEDLSLDLKEFNKVYKKEKEIELKKKKAKTAREVRKRKKIAIEIMIQENQILKKKLEYLTNEFKNHLCDKCKNKINIPYLELSSNSNNINNISVKNKKIYFLTSIIGIICLYILLLNNNFNYNYNNNIRKLINSYKNDYSISKEYILNSSMTSNGIYMLYQDYYSILHQKPLLGNPYFEFIKDFNIINENNITQDINPDNCKNCLVELNKDCISVTGPLHFKIYLNPKFLSTPSFNKTFINRTLNGNTYFTYYEFNVTGYSLNQGVFINNNKKI